MLVKPTVIQQARDSVSLWNTFTLDIELTAADGKKMMVSKMFDKTPVFCPFCIIRIVNTQQLMPYRY